MKQKMLVQPPYQIIGNVNPPWLCPDLLSIRNVGPADGWRGHLVRGFLRLLKWGTGV